MLLYMIPIFSFVIIYLIESINVVLNKNRRNRRNPKWAKIPCLKDFERVTLVFTDSQGMCPISIFGSFIFFKGLRIADKFADQFSKGTVRCSPAVFCAWSGLEASSLPNQLRRDLCGCCQDRVQHCILALGTNDILKKQSIPTRLYSDIIDFLRYN